MITETVFQWDAMGRMFQQGLLNSDPNPVMAFFLVVATIAVIFNIIADLLYAVLDPQNQGGTHDDHSRTSRTCNTRPARPSVDRIGRGHAGAEGDRRALPGADRPAPVLPAQGRDDLADRADLRAAAVGDQHRHRADPRLVEVDALRPARAARIHAASRRCRSPFFGGAGFAIGDHPFGQDETGRDMFAAIMRGIQNTHGRHHRAGHPVDARSAW